MALEQKWISQEMFLYHSVPLKRWNIKKYMSIGKVFEFTSKPEQLRLSNSIFFRSYNEANMIQLTFARTHPPLSKISVERLFLKVPTFSLCSITWQNSAGTVSALAKIAVERHGFLVPWRILLRVERFFISKLQGFNYISPPLLLLYGLHTFRYWSPLIEMRGRI